MQASQALQTIAGWTRFTWFESFLITALLVSPGLMLLYDGPLDERDSISDFHAMMPPEAYFIPLTALFMLFVTNAVLEKSHWYNYVIGGFLLGLLIFNNSEFGKLHDVFAGLFFIGSLVVILFISVGIPMYAKAVAATGMIAALVLWRPLDVYPLFWAEWFSLAFMALHYFLDALPDRAVPYRVPDNTERVKQLADIVLQRPHARDLNSKGSGLQ